MPAQTRYAQFKRKRIVTTITRIFFSLTLISKTSFFFKKIGKKPVKVHNPKITPNKNIKGLNLKAETISRL